jgi:hypothetical protein
MKNILNLNHKVDDEPKDLVDEKNVSAVGAEESKPKRKSILKKPTIDQDSALIKGMNNQNDDIEITESPKRSSTKKLVSCLEGTLLNKVGFEKEQKEFKKQLERKDLYNREKSKLACLIRKKYTALMKESIRQKGLKEKTVCCSSLRSITKQLIYQITGTFFQAILSLFAIVMYIVGTYYDSDGLYTLDHDDPDYRTLIIIRYCELAIAILITFDYIWNLVLAKSKVRFIFSFLNILDIITVLPIYISMFLNIYKSLGFVRVFRVVRIMRIFRFYRIITKSNKKEDKNEGKSEISRRVITSIMTVLAVVFLSSGIVHFLNESFPDYFRISIPRLDTLQCNSGANSTNVMEANLNSMEISLKCPDGDYLIKKNGKLTFDLAFYYMVITMTTVGYGDIYPETSWMRLVIGIFVIVSIITISKQTTEFNDLIRLNSEYQVGFKETSSYKHVVLSGFFNKSSLIRFLNEFYHIDHKEKSENVKIVIIGNEFPDKEIQSILLNPKFEENLHYIIGDIFSEATLHKAKVSNANSIFLVSDQNHSDSIKNDQYLILACKAISQYSHASLYAQFNYSQSLLHDWADWDMACSSQQIKMSIIVKNGFIPGFSTMIMNLSSSSSTIYNSEIKESPWLLEYIHGASQEIYIVEVPQNTEIVAFNKFVERAYLEYGTLIIGIKKKKCTVEDKDIFYFLYLLNPIDYDIAPGDELIVISSDLDSAKIIFEDMKFKKLKSDIYGGETRENDEKDREVFVDAIKVVTAINDDITIHNNEFDLDRDEELNIPSIFQKRQHFKIWENNPSDFLNCLNNHYIIFCKEDHLWEFMNCFDKYYTDVVFFVSDQHPSAKWDIIKRYFKNLVYIECSYSDQDDLEKLRLEQAKHIFILTYAVENSNVSDSGILPLVKIIEENFPNAKYTLELSDELNVRYLNNQGSEDMNIHSKRKERSKISRIPVRMWPKYAKSDIYFSSSLDSLLAFSYHNDGLLDVLTKLLGISNGITDPCYSENEKLCTYIYVSDDKITYDIIVKQFLRLSPPIIPIALYRMTKDIELKNELPYIITNPKKDLMLNRFDKIICIGGSKFEFEKYNESDYQYDNHDEFDRFNDHNNIGKKRKSTLYEIDKFEDLEVLDEDQLLEKLKTEIKSLKSISKKTSSKHNFSFRKKYNVDNIKIIEEKEDEELFKDDKEEREDTQSVNSSMMISEVKGANGSSYYNNNYVKDDKDQEEESINEEVKKNRIKILRVNDNTSNQSLHNVIRMQSNEGNYGFKNFNSLSIASVEGFEL